MAEQVADDAYACSRFQHALYECRDCTTDIVREEIAKENRFATAAIPDGGSVDFHDNNDTIVYGVARQEFMGYRDIDATPRDLVDVDIPGRDCDGKGTDFSTLGNEMDPNACHGACEFKFGQGFEVYETKDYIFPMKTPELCMMDYIRQGPAHVKGFFNSLMDSLAQYGRDNFEANLENLVIKNGRANSSVTRGEFTLNENGFHAPPTERITIYHLRKYRQYMIREGAISDTGILTVSMPREDWLDAVALDKAKRDSSGDCCPSVNTEMFKDERGKFLGRDQSIYNGIRCIFDELPVRGYFKPDGVINGKPHHSFVRVYHWKNEVATEGGVKVEHNHDYDRSEVRCNGQSYKMVTLAFVIHPKSFTRYPLAKPMKPKGGANAGTNFEMIIKDKDSIQCNDWNDKFYIAWRHFFRFKCEKTEWSGAIAYCHSEPEAYYMPVNKDCPAAAPDEPAGPEEFEQCGADDCEQEHCEECVGEDTIADVNTGKCVPKEDAAPTQFKIVPCPEIDTIFTGSGEDKICVSVERFGDDLSEPAAVEVTLVDGTAVFGTDYDGEQVSELTWAAGEGGCKKCCIDIIAGAAAPEPDPEAEEDVCPCGDEECPELPQSDFQVTLTDASVGTLSPECSALTVNILNASV